jgi:hypothetical protein
MVKHNNFKIIIIIYAFLCSSLPLLPCIIYGRQKASLFLSFIAWDNKASQTRWPLPIDNLLYIYLLLCPHSKHPQKQPFQSKQSKHIHQRNRFIWCETGSNKVRLRKSWIQCHIVPVPVGAEPNKSTKPLTPKWLGPRTHDLVEGSKHN